MARLSQIYERNNLPENVNLPAGAHSLTISKADLRASKKGGQYIALLLTNPQGFVNYIINIDVPASEKATEIGLKALRQLMTAIKLDKLSDTDQLVGRRLVADISYGEDIGFGPQANVSRIRADGLANANTSKARPTPEPFDDDVPF